MMETEVFVDSVGDAADIIKNGGLVAVPTETVYGLAANGLDASAVEMIYEVKGRPSVKPLSLMVSSSKEIDLYCRDVPEQAYKLAERFWPGPLTIILKAKDNIPEIVRAGGDTVGLRCPDSALTLQLIREVAVPLAAPSANPSGSRSPRTASDVLEYFNGVIDAVIDGGECTLGTESTIIDMSSVPFRILRQGALPEKTIGDALADELMIIGITGGSGSGKTTALNCLECFGALVIDCDDLYHKMLRTDGGLIRAVTERFPEALGSDGEIDRKALGKTVFSNSVDLLDLNRITHGYIISRVKEMLREFAFSGGRLAALDAVELISSGVSGLCDFTVAVVSDIESRIRRITARDGIGREDALRRISAQKSDDYYMENCTHVLRNDSSFEDFENRSKQLFGGLIDGGYEKRTVL